MWGRASRKVREAVEETLTEAGQIVTGEVADKYSVGDRLPPWVIINTLAHADERRLRTVATNDAPHPGSWRAITAYLAFELLANCTDTRDLVQIQRDVLVPLELRLLTSEARQPRTPAQLASMVTEGISELRSGE